MTQITNRRTLLDTVHAYAHRNDLATFDAQIVKAAEFRIDNSVKIPENEISVSVETMDNTVTLPSDLLELRRVTINKVEYTKATSPQDIQLDQGANSPTRYAVINNMLQFFPKPPEGEPVIIDLTYYKALTPLIIDVNTNEVLEEHPMLYLYGCLIETSLLSEDLEKSQYWQGEFDKYAANLSVKYNELTWFGIDRQEGVYAA